MKFNLLLLFHIALLFSPATSFANNEALHIFPVSVEINTDTSVKSWIDDFKTFRDAVYRGDATVLKNWFSFPVLNPANEIWYLVLNEKELAEKKLTNKITAFTEADFDKYYKKLFPVNFSKALLKIKSAQLNKQGRVETPEVKDTNNTIVKMYADIDKRKNTLTLNLSYTSSWKEEGGEVADGGESNVIYVFRIIKNHLQFMYVRLAG